MIVKLSIEKVNPDKAWEKEMEGVYISEKEIKNIKGYEKWGFDIELENGEIINNVKTIEYPTTPTTPKIDIDTVSVNQHTDISNLSSVLNKLDKTLNKLLDK